MEAEQSEGGMDLTIWRRTTSNRLNLETEEAHEAPFPMIVRLFISVFTIFSFVMITGPRANMPDGYALDTTVNITVITPLKIDVSSTAASWSVSYPSVVPSSQVKGATPPAMGKSQATKAGDPTTATTTTATTPTKPNATISSWSWLTRPFSGASSSTSSAASARTSVLAIPAIFGKVFNSPIKFAPMVAINEDACSPFRVKLPILKVPSELLTDKNGVQVRQKRTGGNAAGIPLSDVVVDQVKFSQNSSSSATSVAAHNSSTDSDNNDADKASDEFALSNWFVLVARGNCPFDVKILNAQLAGFAGCVIYNNGSAMGSIDLPIRMSANTLGTQVTETFAFFLTNQDGKKLLRAGTPDSTDTNSTTTAASRHKERYEFYRAVTPTHAMLVSLSPHDWPTYTGWGGNNGNNNNNGGQNGVTAVPGGPPGFSLLGFIGDVLLLTIVVMLCGGICTGFCIAVTMIKNYFVHGRLFVVLVPYLLSGGEDEEHQHQNGGRNTRRSRRRRGGRLLWSQRFGRFAAVGGTPLDFGDEDDDGGDLEGEEMEELDTLEKITLPVRVITQQDLEDGTTDDLEMGEGRGVEGTRTQARSTARGGTRECCAICIDEFVVGSRVRELPCHHQFHDSCIDPWLLNHNRLCPICKRDVLAAPPRIPTTLASVAVEDVRELTYDSRSSVPLSSRSPENPIVRSTTVNVAPASTPDIQGHDHTQTSRERHPSWFEWLAINRGQQ
ncbi:E3 ubiquitin-protein ligase rnf13 [Blyttiomyces sp. JEL0837]|nr:E3 ubiquitin-protein ligase rnf13 [Blyttiomyces sp. JEL0837]